MARSILACLSFYKMQWPSWAFWRQKPESDDTEEVTKKEDVTSSRESRSDSIPVNSSRSWDNNLNRTDWTQYTTTQALIFYAITTGATLALVRLYKSYLRRIPTADYLKPSFFRRRNLYGYVTRVGDGDNFHLFHTPGGKLTGWGWLPKRRVQDIDAAAKKKKTVHVRIAGIDAPEMAHFGRPAQPYSQEALDWLKSFVLHKYVRAYPYRPDQYGRVVCTVYRRRWFFFKSDVGLNMLKSGLATVYEAKFGSEFGNKEEQYRAAEERAKQKQIGMWQEPGLVARLLGKSGSFESPRDYKTRMSQSDGKAPDKGK